MLHTPVTERAFFVLTVLADAPRHGYGLAGEVAELSHGQVRLKIGSLYGVLDQLAAEELIEPDREEARDGRLRRYWLTEDGRRALALGQPPRPAVIARGLRSLRAVAARMVRARLRRTARRAAA